MRARAGWILGIVLVVAASAGCDRSEAPAAAAAHKPAAAAPVASLAGTAWQLVKFTGSDGTQAEPDDPTKYTLAFQPDGVLVARIDCNRGRGGWKSDAPGQLLLGPLALTRMMCPPDSMHDRVAADIDAVRSYALKDGHLLLSLMADGGTYEYEPAPASPSG
ncbi:MAG TPA: META domain-containing protein [Rhodanobacteraceae bacterium]|nr:META domain-containing protein [Rhodanobacteraceae bacterium]